MEKETKEKLNRIFQIMKANLAKVDLLSMFTHEFFCNFPASLPKESTQSFMKDINTLNEVKKHLSSLQFTLLTKENYEELGISEEFGRFFQNFSNLLISEQNKDFKSLEFEQVLYRQEFISIYSYLEGYFQDIQRLLYENDKTLLSNKDKQVLLNDILEADSYESIISQIIETKLARSGYDKISDIIDKWKREPFRLILKLKGNDLSNLDKFTCIRNIIIHNNSKINKELLKFLDTQRFEIGQTFRLDNSIMKEYRELVFDVVFSTYLEICLKYPTTDNV